MSYTSKGTRNYYECLSDEEGWDDGYEEFDEKAIQIVGNGHQRLEITNGAGEVFHIARNKIPAFISELNDYVIHGGRWKSRTGNAERPRGSRREWGE